MSIPTQMSLAGFIATVPDLHFSKAGAPRFHARVGCEHFRKEVDGSFTKLDPEPDPVARTPCPENRVRLRQTTRTTTRQTQKRRNRTQSWVRPVRYLLRDDMVELRWS